MSQENEVSSEETKEGTAPQAEAPADSAAPAPEPAAPEPAVPDASDEAPAADESRTGMMWYVLRVASNKEDQVCEALGRKVKIEGLENYIGRIVVPTQKEKRMRGGQARIVERKLYPGYVFVEMMTEEDGSLPEDVWFMVKETMGVGDFIGSDGKPTAMAAHDVDRMLEIADRREEEPGLGIPFSRGDRVKIREGSFENYEGDVEAIEEQKGTVTVLLTIFGRSTPVDVEYWLLEKL
jgi:transcriptional antiterminator NusG